MQAAKRSLTSDLSRDEKLQLSREIWGNKPNLIVQKYTGDNEYYTPSKYVEAARQVMGGIDLDPASCTFAQKTVKATEHYTEEDDGLVQEWAGRVFLNPPYAYPLVQQFINKLCESFARGDVTQAVLLTNNSADTKWFHDAAIMAGTICLTLGRINFLKEDGPESSPTNGQAFFYFGDNARAFADKFSAFGLILTVRDD